MLLASCVNGNREYDEADLSSFGEYVHALDTLQLERHLAHLLDADTSRWVADKTVRQHYTDKDGVEDAPLWFSRAGVSPLADSLLAYLRRELPSNGLDTLAFFIPQIAADLDVVHKLAFDSVGQSINEVLPRLDYYLSKAYVRYTVGQRYGFVMPDKLLNFRDYKRDGEGFARLFDYDVKAPDYEEALRTLTSGDRMSYLHDSHPSGYVFKALQADMAKTNDTEKRHKLAVNMERCRWQIQTPDERERQVLVNIPSQQLWAISPETILPMRICCGSVATKTPLLHSEISHMQVNPDWIIPRSIIKNEVVPHAGDTAYFMRHRYYIVDRETGDTLDPAGVDGNRLKSVGVRVGQKGGAGNSLGRIVFRFSNNFGVYLHDTSNRRAFQRERRTLSHGCVRVEKPFDLACFLLSDADEWTQDRLRISMDIRPETDQGQEYLLDHAEDPRPLRAISYKDVIPHVPVYIIYYTAYPDPETGIVEYWPDLYGYDEAISREMNIFLPH